MKSTLRFFAPFVISLALIACKNNTSTPQENIQEPPTETVETVTGEFIEDSENGPYTLYKASALKWSEQTKKLAELVFYEKSEVKVADEESEIEDIIRRLYPLGWSKEGNFAFAEYSVEYHGEHLIKYSIKNMTSGDEVWSEEFTFGMLKDTAEFYPEMGAEIVILINGNESDDELFKYAWTITEKKVMDALNAGNIVFNPSTTILRQSNYQDLSFSIEQIQSEEEHYEVEYLLKSDKHAAKVIFKDAWDAYHPKVVGIIESPFSKTIAVICSQKEQAFEMTNQMGPILTGYALD